jgi:hypothetical protein
MIKLLLILALFFSHETQAQFQVTAVRGEAHFDQQAVTLNQVLTESGVLKTEARSFVRLVHTSTRAELVLGGNAELALDGQFAAPLELRSGSARWVGSLRGEALGSEGVQMTTNTAALGVRGTDFFLKVNTLLGESEVVVFSGQIEFISRTDAEDRVQISKGQWGGIGGRFGPKMVQPITLPGDALEHFNRYLRL